MLMKVIWSKEQTAPDWSVGIIYVVYKKGDRRECESFRGTALMSCMYKIISGIICSGLIYCTENITGDYQTGFRPHRGMVDNMHIMKQVTEKT